MNNIKYIKYIKSITKIRNIKKLYTQYKDLSAWQIYYLLRHNNIKNEKEIEEASKLSNFASMCGFNTTKEAVNYFNDDT